MSVIGDVSGEWSSKAKDALRQFARATKISLPADEPTEAALQALRDKEGKVCPLTCDPGKIELNGKCVAKAQREQPKPKIANQPAARKASKPEDSQAGASCFSKCWAESQGRNGGYGGASMGATNCTAICGGR